MVFIEEGFFSWEHSWTFSAIRMVEIHLEIRIGVMEMNVVTSVDVLIATSTISEVSCARDDGLGVPCGIVGKELVGLVANDMFVEVVECFEDPCTSAKQETNDSLIVQDVHQVDQCNVRQDHPAVLSSDSWSVRVIRGVASEIVFGTLVQERLTKKIKDLVALH